MPVLPLAQFMELVRPDHWGELHTWEEERDALLAEPRSRATLAALQASWAVGERQLRPVLVNPHSELPSPALGVLDGHHRVVASWLSGRSTIWYENAR